MKKLFTLLTVTLMMLCPASMFAAWSYFSNGNVLSAFGEGGYTTGNPLSITLNAPTDLQFNGNYKPATISNTDAWTAAGLTVPTILYDGKTNAPSMLGTYAATISAGGATAEVVYTIKTVIDYKSFFHNGITQGTNYDVVPGVGVTTVPLNNTDSSGVWWDPTENCAVFDGQAYLQIENPLGNVNANTGFTLTIDAYIDSRNNNSTQYWTAKYNAYRTMNGWQRLFDLSDGHEDHCIYLNAGSSSHLGWDLRLGYGSGEVYKANTSGKSYWNQWCTITMVVAPGGYTTLYVNGEVISHSSSADISKIVNVLNSIHNFNICFIGTSIFEAACINTDGFFIGKIRGFQTAEGALMPYYDGSNYHYLLSYETNGGNPITGTFEAAIPNPLPTPTYADASKVFKGWYMDEALTIPVVSGTPLTGNTAIYAKWGYLVSMADGTEDVSHWTLSHNQATEGMTINVDYSGSKRVKNVTIHRDFGSFIEVNNSTNSTTVQNNFNDTSNEPYIVATGNFNANLILTRTEGEVDLNGYANSGWFNVRNNEVGKAIIIRNGSFLDIDGIGGWGTSYHGTVILENITCRHVFTDGMNYIIRGGIYENIHNYKSNGTPGMVTIYGGKFKAFNTDGHNPNGTTDGTYTLYGGMYKFDPRTVTNCTMIIPDGYSVQLNPDLDNRDYPWAVVKNSDPYAQTGVPGIDLTEVAPNQWTFTMPAYNVEVEVTYYSDVFYNVTLADGTIDAANWTISPTTAQEGATIGLNYNGTLKVDEIALYQKNATLLDANNGSSFQDIMNDPAVEHPYVVLTENIPCLPSVYITKQEGTVDLSGYNMCVNLYIQNDVEGKTLTLRNGHVQGGADGDGGCAGSRRGTVVLDNMIIDGTLWCDGHEFYIYNTTIGGDLQNIQFNNYPSKVTIFSGHFNALRHSCGNYTGRGQYVVYGGKFKEDYSSWNICASGYSFQANTDEDAATYPYEVKPIAASPAPAHRPNKAPTDQHIYHLTEVTPNSAWTFNMPAADVEVQIIYGLYGQGIEADPYVIPSLDNWNVLAASVKNGNTYAGKVVRQTADVSGVTNMVGTDSYRFAGTYDGGEHTLSLNINTNDDSSGPFRFVNGATIKDLHVAGELTTSMRYAGGLIGRNYGTTNIINCRNSVNMHTGCTSYQDITCGGFVGLSHGSVNMTGCLFDGSITNTDNDAYCGGFIGWIDGGNTANFTNCLFAPSQVTDNLLQMTYARGGGNRNLYNSYYTQTYNSTAQGKQIHAITGTSEVIVAPANTETYYNVSGIRSYGTGIQYGDVLYGGQGDVISLNLDHNDKAGFVFNNYSANNGTLSESGNPYTLTMVNANTTISAEWIPIFYITANEDPQHAGLYYSTFYHGWADYELPAHVAAYSAVISGQNMNLTKIADASQTIPAHNAVILQSTVSDYILNPSDATPVTIGENALEGTDEDMPRPSNGEYYTLSAQSGEVGFYHYVGDILHAHKAFIHIAPGMMSNTPPALINFVFLGEQVVTGMESMEPSAIGTQKIIENGQLVIIKNGVRYNAQGQIVK